METNQKDYIFRKVLVQGDPDSTSPSIGDQVQIAFEGRLLDTKDVFMSSYDANGKEQLFSFTLEDPNQLSAQQSLEKNQFVIRGWHMAIAMMTLGEKSQFTIRPEIAYGSQGNQQIRVPSNATLVYQIELVQINEMKVKRRTLTDEEKFEEAKKIKDFGNQLFAEGSFEDALQAYRDSLTQISSIDDETAEVRDFIVKLFQNMAVITNKQGNHQETLRHTSTAIEIEPEAAKAWFLRSVARDQMEHFDAAIDDIKAAIRLAPNQTVYREHLNQIKQHRKTKFEYVNDQLKAENNDHANDSEV